VKNSQWRGTVPFSDADEKDDFHFMNTVVPE
jgi:hypothetical protein